MHISATRSGSHLVVKKLRIRSNGNYGVTHLFFLVKCAPCALLLLGRTLGLLRRTPCPLRPPNLGRLFLKTMDTLAPLLEGPSAFITACSKSSWQLSNIKKASPSNTWKQCVCSSRVQDGSETSKSIVQVQVQRIFLLPEKRYVSVVAVT